MQIETFGPERVMPEEVILPHQVHGSQIIEIVTGTEDLRECDGIWTQKQRGACHKHFLLGIKTADCAPIVFWDEKKYGVIHSGWRGLVNGIIEKMEDIFRPNPQKCIWVGPIYPVFEIQKDFCYEALYEKFGDSFFTFSGSGIVFDFKATLQSLLPTATFDPRSTYIDLRLASWRRDQDQRRNVTVIGL